MTELHLLCDTLSSLSDFPLMHALITIQLSLNTDPLQGFRALFVVFLFRYSIL